MVLAKFEHLALHFEQKHSLFTYISILQEPNAIITIEGAINAIKQSQSKLDLSACS